MKSFRSEVWSYAILLVILFSISAIAVWQTILRFQPHSSPDDLTFPIVMWSLTLGFMLIAGSYGLWAIKFSAEAESRRRIGRFVDAMTYFKDGLLAVDRKGRINGSNPASSVITGITFEKKMPFASTFPYLSDREIDMFLNSEEPAEAEQTVLISGSPTTLRFRSQPSEDMTLIAISDVTAMNEERLHNRQRARLELVGNLARGMAHDFNRLLCEISANASLLQRVPPGSPEMINSLTAMNKNVESGITLAGHLLGLAQPDFAFQLSDSLEIHITRTAELLRDTLPIGWKVETSVPGEFPAIGLTGIQIEQVLFNLGILSADVTRTPETVTIAAMKPGNDYLLSKTNKQFSALILVTTSSSDMAVLSSQQTVQKTYGDAGIILSVIRSTIEEAGGEMECLTAGDGAPVYRVAFPLGSYRKTAAGNNSVELADELKSYIAQWSILLAGSARELAPLQQYLNTIGVKIEVTDNIMSLLSHIEGDQKLDAVIISKHLLGQESKGLLKAILKLRPSASVVVLTDGQDIEPGNISNDVIFESTRSGTGKILTAMLEARSLAVSRKHR